MKNKCKKCGTIFSLGYQKPKNTEQRYYKHSFCSKICENNYKGNKLNCKICNKTFYRTNTLRTCCSLVCLNKYKKIKQSEANKKRNHLYGWFSRTIYNKKESISIKPWKTKELIQHIEKQFTSEMNWNNYGSYWHIDHLIPLSWFKNKKQALKFGWRLKNLRPIPAKENLSKSNKYVGITFEKDLSQKIIYL